MKHKFTILSVSGLSDMFVNTENCISDCMHKLLNSGENCYDKE